MNGNDQPRTTVAVVTGASGGIGRAVTAAIAAECSHVVLHYFSNREAISETEAVASGAGAKSLVIQADLADLHERRRLVDAAWQWQGRIDRWIHVAGADVLTGAAADRTFDEKLDYLWQVDVRGTIDCCREAGRRMRDETENPRPSIVTVGWDQADQGMEGESGEMFATIKGAIAAFTRSLAQSLAPHVRVNCVAPGWIQTKWGSQASSLWHTRAAGQSLMQRWGQPADVAAAVHYLSSPAADFISGQILHVNGGFCYYSE